MDAFGDDTAPGPLQQAAHGSLYIEDVAALPLQAQASLERALAAATGAPRIIAASARDLLTEVRAGRFREGLYYRLKIVEVTLPPLTERAEASALAAFFLASRPEQIASCVSPRRRSRA